MKRIFVLAAICFLQHFLCSGLNGFFTASAQVSPNGRIRVQKISGGLSVDYKRDKEWQSVCTFQMNLDENSVGKSDAVTKVRYEMLTGKRSTCSNAYREYAYGVTGEDTRVRVRVYNDGVAIKAQKSCRLVASFVSACNSWLQRWNEAYEGFFPQNPRFRKDERIAYPALFEFENDVFALLTESDVRRDEAASSMYCLPDRNRFELRSDGDEDGGWQTLIVGSLNDVVESTLVTDNSAPCRFLETAWIRPGVASWVYWAHNHGSNNYDIIKNYVDMAVDLHLPYVLIDAEWDEMKGGKTIEDAVRYAVDHGVDPIIWYNSSVGWIDGAPGPKFRLNTYEDREKEFEWCERIGVRGVKIDFFSGDSNRNVKYMIELLESAAHRHLLVNFHGATLPRGWQRTYPNLISTEGVYGAEWYNNVPTFTWKAASHNAILPFTRNVVGSMDYTPCAFSDSQHPHITSHAHELALTALFESGIQHLADRPESFLAQPQEVRDYLGSLPTAWDDTRLLAGYPSDYVVLARRKGTDWYVAGINGKDEACRISFDLSSLGKLGSKMTVFEDATESGAKWKITERETVKSFSFDCRPRGGFLVVIKKEKKK